MNGNVDLDGIVFDLMVEKYGLKEVLEFDFDFDNAVYSDGFINALEDGLVPEMKLHSTTANNGYYANQQEYHHVCVNDECFKMYFVEK